jgi:hypothetical protein
MLWGIIVFLVAIWLIATLVGWVLGGFIHLLLLVALVVLVYRLFANRNTA